jgi:hypothetical protein
MSKVTPKISPPGSITMPSGGHTDGVQKGGHNRGGALAQPGRSVPMGQAQGRLPIRKPTANLANTTIGQPNPQTGAVATKKPNRKGGAAFYGES